MNNNKAIILIKNKQFLFIFLPLGFILLFIIFITILFNSTSTQITNNKPKYNQQITKTNPHVIYKKSALMITATTPINQSINNSLFTVISVTFNHPINTVDQKQIQLSLSPYNKGIVSWSNANKTINYTPIDSLWSNTEYQINLNYFKNSLSWKFTTVLPENTTQQDQMKEQQQADNNYKAWEKQTYTTYPWLDNLPLQKDTYFVYFSLDKKAFIAKIYPKSSSSLSQDQQISTIETEIQENLTNIGIDINLYKFNWEINPE
jgi:hypothetical protein